MPPAKTAKDLIQAMHDRYAARWYKTLTFVQKSTTFKPDGTSQTVTWYEALSAPGKLRIDFDPVKDGNGILFINDTQHVFKDGKLASSRERIHPLLVLGFDVYAQPVQTTIEKLQKLKIDLSIVREDTWQGRPVYVVGAKAGDLRSSQFWIDKERLLFVRLIEPAGGDNSVTHETLFNKYEPVKGGGWISPEVVFMVNGIRTFLEEYSDIRANVALDEKLFDPAHFSAVHWR
jgi:hypothetical protein